MLESQDKQPSMWLRRWCMFNLVGLMGIVIQLAVICVLHGWLEMHYMFATAIAVEGAVLHNFVWHEHWTWSDRTSGHDRGVLGRLARFNLSTGVVSIASNLALMSLFVDCLGLYYLPANLLSIAVCSLVHFFVSDRFVFTGRSLHPASAPKSGMSNAGGIAPYLDGGNQVPLERAVSQTSAATKAGRKSRAA